MNWLFLNPIKSHDWGGMENWMLKLCLGLRDQGDACLVVGRPASAWPEVCRQHDLPFEPFRFGVDLAPWALVRLRRIVAAFRPDIGVAKGFRQVRFLRAACPGITLGAKMPTVGELKDTPIDRLTFSLCLDRVLVDSHEARRVCLQNAWVMPGKVVTVHNGVALSDPSAKTAARSRLVKEFGLPPDALLVGGAGRLVADKRYEDAITAVARADAAGRARLILFGDGPQRESLQAQARTLGLAQRVTFAGWQDGVREWLPGLDLLIHPSSKEGLPNVVLEAMAGNVPVVATSAGGTRELINSPDVGRLVPIGDVVSLSAALRELIADRDLRLALAERALARVTAHFSIPVMVSAVRATLVTAHQFRQARGQRPQCDPSSHGTKVTMAGAPDADLSAEAGAPDATLVSSSPRAKVVRILRSGQTFYLKQFRYPPQLAWRYAWRRPEALTNFRTAQALALAGVDVVPHLAAFWREGRLRGESILMTGVVPGAVPLTDVIADAGRFALWRRRGLDALAAWLGHLHATGIAPHDLKAANLLCTGGESSAPTLFLLDLDNGRMRRWCGVTRHEAERNLHQCFRSFQPRITRRDVLRFAARYRRTRRLSRPVFRRMLATVEVRLHRRGTGFAELT